MVVHVPTCPNETGAPLAASMTRASLARLSSTRTLITGSKGTEQLGIMLPAAVGPRWNVHSPAIWEWRQCTGRSARTPARTATRRPALGRLILEERGPSLRRAHRATFRTNELIWRPGKKKVVIATRRPRALAVCGTSAGRRDSRPGSMRRTGHTSKRCDNLRAKKAASPSNPAHALAHGSPRRVDPLS